MYNKVGRPYFFKWLFKDDERIALALLRSRGGHLYVPVNDVNGREIYLFGDTDPKITWLCWKLLREGDTFLDIGANLGAVSTYAAGFIGPRGTVHAFEPQTRLTELLKKSVSLNGHNHIVIHNMALSEKDERKELFIPKGHSGGASINRCINKEGTRIPIHLVNTSDYLKKLGLGHIRLIKIDVEGHEGSVLRGGYEYFKSNPPDAVLFENDENKISFWNTTPVILLDQLGYSFFEIRKVFFRMRLFKIDKSQGTHAYGHDILAVHEEKYDEIANLVKAK